VNQDQIIQCQRCPRLLQHCKSIGIEKRRAYKDEDYWAKPVPDFGKLPTKLLIVGLAPAAHGANRTGRMFTGDRSGEWLYRALFEFGFASQPNSSDRQDGLVLKDCAITAVVHCAPPQNKPTRQEIQNCSEYLSASIKQSKASAFLALGQLAWSELFKTLASQSLFDGKLPKFYHGAKLQLENGSQVFGSYHPSQQNTFTGKLTKDMFDQVFTEIRTQLSTL